MKTWNERLAYALKAREMTAADLARATKKKPPSVKDWLEKPNMEIGANNALNACDFLKIEFRWLLSGVLPSGIAELDKDLKLPYIPKTEEGEQLARIGDSIPEKEDRGLAVKIVAPLSKQKRGDEGGCTESNNPEAAAK